MAENTEISWCDATFNPWEGCQKVGPGCDNCYAEARNARFGGGQAINWGPGAPRRRTSVSNWKQPLKWDREAKAAYEHWEESGAVHGYKAPRRPRVFCASLADVFDNEVPIAWLVDFLDLCRRTRNLDKLLLTKRIGNVTKRLQEARLALLAEWETAHADLHKRDLAMWIGAWLDGRAPADIWLGATIVNQEEADRDIPKLLAVPARMRFLSMEPLLGDVDLTPHLWGRAQQCADCPKDADCECGWHQRGALPNEPALDWVIVGFESGPGARPGHPQWARDLRDQCGAAGVPFHLKQWGEFIPESQQARSREYPEIVADGAHGCPSAGWPESRVHRWADGSQSYRCGKKAAGRLLDGVEHNGFPDGT